MSLTITPTEIVEKAEVSGHPGLLAKAPTWDRILLGDVARIVNGAAFPSANFNSDGRGLPLIRIRDVNTGETKTSFDGEWEPQHLVRRGDILIGMDGDFRVAHWSGGDSLLNQRVCRLEVDDAQYNPRFLTLALQGYLDAIWHETSSVTVKHLSSRSVAAIPLPKPSLNEQRRIVDLLEDHLSRLDAADNEFRRSLTKLRKLREAGLQSAITGAMPGSSTRTIGDLGTVTSGLTPLRTNRRFHEGGTIPWITSGDLHQGRVLTARNWVTEHALRETSLKIVPAGAILVAMYGEGRTRGTAALLSIDATTNQACAAIRLHDPRLTSWVKVVLDSNYEAMRRLAAGGVQPNLNLSLVRAIRVPVPPAAYREAALDRLDELSAAGKQLRSALTTGQARSSALRHSLLAAAFSGRLTPGASNLSVAKEMIGA